MIWLIVQTFSESYLWAWKLENYVANSLEFLSASCKTRVRLGKMDQEKHTIKT